MLKKSIFVATAQVLGIHDGDTFKAQIDLLENRGLAPAQQVDLGFRFYLESAEGSDAIATAQAAGVHIYHAINIRLRDVYAPELNTVEGPASARKLAALLPVGSTVRIESRRLDKYGRVEGIVTRSDGLNVNDEMKK